jgi:thiol-disulfide isomerase/thioredoxin
MNSKMFFILFSSLSIGMISKSQDSSKMTDQQSIENLYVGDQVPEIYLNNMINYPSKKVKLSDFKGKLTILDMWSTNCTSCIEGFPKNENLQEKFKGKVQFILVTYQSLSEIKDFLKRYKKNTGKATSLPMLCGDTILHKYFKHSGVPHCVWIDDMGVVKSITDGGSVTVKNINSVINHQEITMVQKTDSLISMDYYKPLFIKGNGGNGDGLQYQSVLSKGNPLVLSLSGVFNADSGHSVFLAYNCSKDFLYQIAYNDYINEAWLPKNRVFADIMDTSHFYGTVDGEIQWQDLFLYQLYAPRKSFEEMHRLMQEDLHRYFGYDAKMEKRKMKCWVLTAEDTSLFKSLDTGWYLGFDNINLKMILQNVPFSIFEYRFVYNLLYDSPYPFVNEITYSGNVDLVLDDVVDCDIPRIKKALAKYKMHLDLKERLVDVLLIKDPSKELKKEVHRKYYGISLEDTIKNHLFGR